MTRENNNFVRFGAVMLGLAVIAGGDLVSLTFSTNNLPVGIVGTLASNAFGVGLTFFLVGATGCAPED